VFLPISLNVDFPLYEAMHETLVFITLGNKSKICCF